jgi:hypothetical protein
MHLSGCRLVMRCRVGKRSFVRDEIDHVLIVIELLG